MISRRGIIATITLVVFIIGCPYVFAGTNDLELPVPDLNERCKIINCAYDPYVLNVATDYTPTTSDGVTIWSWSNNSTQWWENEYAGINSHGGDCYRVVLSDDNLDHLGLNYNQSTTKCTIYPYASNDPYDYKIQWQTGAYGYIISLCERGRFLGACDSYLGSQCYWYYGAVYASDNWSIYELS